MMLAEKKRNSLKLKKRQVKERELKRKENKEMLKRKKEERNVRGRNIYHWIGTELMAEGVCSFLTPVSKREKLGRQMC